MNEMIYILFQKLITRSFDDRAKIAVIHNLNFFICKDSNQKDSTTAFKISNLFVRKLIKRLKNYS
jgi:hypothetical protein